MSKTLLLGIVTLALALGTAMTVTHSAFADVKGEKDTGCTNGGGQDVAGKDTCPSSPPQEQDTCNATTGNDKCPKGQNK
jgi:hypothetical protein